VTFGDNWIYTAKRDSYACAPAQAICHKELTILNGDMEGARADLEYALELEPLSDLSAEIENQLE
jgi:hypothetical protein